MIIFGTRGVNKTIERGVFDCPQCERDCDYNYIQVKRYFTLYFIPLIPLGSAGEYVECLDCRSTFVPRVLEYSEDHEDELLSEYEKALQNTMVMMMLADGQIDDKEMLVVQEIINKNSHHDITLDELDDIIDDIEEYPEEISVYLERVTPTINEHGKEIILRSAIAVASADGHIDDRELDLIHEMAEAMEMSRSHIKGILSETIDPINKRFSSN